MADCLQMMETSGKLTRLYLHETGVRTCPFCDEPTQVSGGDSRRGLSDHQGTRVLVHCRTCDRDWCYTCGVPWHNGQSCMEYQTQTTTKTDIGQKKQKVAGLRLRQGECEACYDTKVVWASPCCDCHFCLLCLDTYLSSKVDEGVIDITCPGNACGQLLDPGLIRKVVVNDKSKRLSFLRIKSDRYRNRKACPLCDVVLTMTDAVLAFCMRQRQVVCPQCLRDICITCMLPWHTGYTCAEYRDSKVKVGMDTWAKRKDNKKSRNAQNCPSCKTWIQRTEGCYMMSCSVCKTKFCYDCGCKIPHQKGSKCQNQSY